MDKRKIVFFGASGLGRTAYQQWPASLGEVAFFIDNDAEKWGGQLMGLPICPPEVLGGGDSGSTFVVITSSYYDQIATQLESFGMVEGLHFSSLEQASCLLSLDPRLPGDTDIAAVGRPYLLAFIVPVTWFGLDYCRLQSLCEKKKIKCFFVPPQRKSMRTVLALTKENFKDFQFENIPLFSACKYEVCIKIRRPIEALDPDDPSHWDMIVDYMEQAAAYISTIVSLFDSFQPDMAVVPQGHTIQSAVIRYICVLRGIRIISIENSLNAKKMIWDDISGISVNKISAKNFFWRFEDLVSSEKALDYVHSYFSAVKKNKQDQHQSPDRSLIIDKKKRPTLLFLANVLTDASVLFNSRVGSQIDAIKQTAAVAKERNYNLIIKIHPRERPDHSENYENLTICSLQEDQDFRQLVNSCDHLFIDDKNSYDTYSLIKNSDLCITISSQSGLEAMLLGKETVLLGHTYFGGLGFTHEVQNLCDLDHTIMTALDPKNRRIKQKDIAKFFYIFDDLFCLEKDENSILDLMLKSCGKISFPVLPGAVSLTGNN